MVIISQSYIWNVLSLDEGTYLSVAMLMSKGWVVYRDVFESKPPLFHFINYFIYLIVGNRIHAARLFSIGAAALTAYLIYEIVDMHYSERTAISAAILFSISSSLPIFDGFRILTEPFSTLFLVSMILAHEMYAKKEDPRVLPLIGFLAGAYTLIRPTGILFTATLLILAFTRWKTIQTKRELGQLAAGGLLLPFIFGLYFLSKGALGDLLFWVLEPAQGFTEYVVTNLTVKIQWVTQVILSVLPFILIALPSLTDREKHIHELNMVWIAFLPTVFLVTFLPGFPHYYYELLPALAIQAAVGSNKILQFLSDRSLNVKGVFALVLVLSSGVALYESSSFYNDYRRASDFPLALKVSYDIREHSMPDDTVFIYETAWPKLGPSVYYLSERSPPIHNLFFFPWIMSDIELGRITDTIQVRDPTLVILIGPDSSIPEVMLIHELVLDHYTLIKEYTDNTGIYPHIEEDTIHIWVYKRTEN